MKPCRWVLGLLLAASGAAPGSTLAQQDARLTAAVRLAQEGRSDSARAIVGRLLAALNPADSLYPEALFTSGLLAATERDRRVALRRVLVDYAQSGWADDALLQLAQLDHAAGDPAAVVRQTEQLLRDYPSSPLAAQAAFWGARAAGDRRDAAAACRLADLGLAAAGSDVELRNQLAFQKQRCQGLQAMAAESARTAAADSVARARADSVARATASARPRSGYYVQVSAVPAREAAAAESARLRRAGYQAVVVREGGFFKIRAGPYPARAEAQAALTRIRGRLGGRPFIVRVP